MPLELDLQRQPTDWRRWNKIWFHLDDDAHDEHSHDEHADEDEADADDGDGKDDADADDGDGEDHLSLHLSE